MSAVTKYRLAEHQAYASSLLDSVDALAIFYEAGTGKTMCALDWLYRAIERGEVRSALIVCPASLTGNWDTSIDKMLQFQGYASEGVARVHEAVSIRSFQKLYKSHTEEVKHHNGRIGSKRIVTLRADVDRRWDAVIIDESQGIGNHKSTQTKVCLALSKLAGKRVIMSGTPVSGGGGAEDFQKLYGQLKFLDDSVWKNWKDFCEKYVVSYDFWGNPDKYRVEELRQLMKDYGIVARLADCYDMPSSTDTVISCPLAESQAYDDFQHGALEDYGLEIDNAGTVYLKLLQLCSGSVKGTSYKFKCSKDSVLSDLLDGTDDKVVVFCQYRASVDKVAAILRKHGKTVVYDGRSKGETWREFQFGDAQYLVCQYQSGGVGRDLFASATMVLWEPCLSSLILEQTKARIHRKGQERHCTYYHLVTPNSIESRVHDTVMSGVKITREMLDKWAKE